MSDKSEPVSVSMEFADLCGKLPPFGQRIFPVLLEPVAVVDVALEIEMIVDGRMDGGELSKVAAKLGRHDGSFYKQYSISAL